MNKIVWKSLLLIGALVVSFIFFLWYANYRMNEALALKRQNCEETARKVSIEQANRDESGIAVPSKEIYDTAYNTCMEDPTPLFPQ